MSIFKTLMKMVMEDDKPDPREEFVKAMMERDDDDKKPPQKWWAPKKARDKKTPPDTKKHKGFWS